MASVDVEAGPSGIHSNKYSASTNPSFPKPLTPFEKQFFLAVERGNVAAVRRILDDCNSHRPLNINCVDSLGRSTVLIAIENENLKMVRLLVTKGVEIKDALLHAIDKEYVECVEFLLDHEELIHEKGQPYSWEKMDKDTATFTPEITPLILAGHRDNYEILKVLLDHGATLPVPHDVRCPCDDCVLACHEDSLRYSRWRFNAYRALSSPSLISLSSTDPILTAFELCWELENLSVAENEYKEDYLDLQSKCQDFAMDLLAQARSSRELEVLLNYDPSQTCQQLGHRMNLARLKVAIEHNQKMFVAHPNVQQLLSSLWYEGLPGFRRKTLSKQIFEVIKVIVLFPFYSIVYIVSPTSSAGRLMRKPFMKFLIHSASYLFFLLLLILASQRVETLIMEILEMKGWISPRNILTDTPIEKGNPPTIVEWTVFIYVAGFIWQETKQLTYFGLRHYISDMWNGIEFIRNTLYVTTIGLRCFAFIQAKIEIYRNPAAAFIPREHWGAYDPLLIAEGLFAAANIFSALKLLHMFSINPYLGPLQISLGRMVIDIIKFFFIYSLVLFSFACGLNQLLWYYADLERQKCYSLPGGLADWKLNADSCMIWRRFINLFETSQSLFWASFGMIDLRNFELTGIQSYTRFWALLMFGSYSVINIIVLLNLLIAMMSNSYNAISDRSDTEWKFARTKLWLSYFDEGSTVPPPFNLVPSPKSILRCLGCCKKDKQFQDAGSGMEDSHLRYQAVVQAIVWRYITAQQRNREMSIVTEDTVNEVKQDISAFRYELLDVLGKNGMEVTKRANTVQRRPSADKKSRVWERRLLSDFSVAPVDSCCVEETPQGAEQSHTKFQRLVRNMGSSQKKTSKLWRSLAMAARKNSEVMRIQEEDAVKDLEDAPALPIPNLEAAPELLSQSLEDVPELPIQSQEETTNEADIGLQVDECNRPNCELMLQNELKFDASFTTPDLMDSGPCLMPDVPQPELSIPSIIPELLEQMCVAGEVAKTNELVEAEYLSDQPQAEENQVAQSPISESPSTSQTDPIEQLSETMADEVDALMESQDLVDDQRPLLQSLLKPTIEENLGVSNLGYDSAFDSEECEVNRGTRHEEDPTTSTGTASNLTVPQVSVLIPNVENVKVIKRKFQGAWF